MFATSHRFTFRSSLPKYTLATSYFTLRYQTVPDEFQIAIVVGKKVNRKAVIRNNLKRRLGEIVKGYLSLATPFCCVFYVKRDMVRATNQEIRDSVEQVFTKIGIISSTSGD